MVTRDGITNEGLKGVNGVLMGVLLQIYNGCLRNGCFPEVWKLSEVVWIPKEDGSLRPTCLLLVLEKVLGKLLADRIAHFMEKIGNLAETNTVSERGGVRCRRLVTCITE